MIIAIGGDSSIRLSLLKIGGDSSEWYFWNREAIQVTFLKKKFKGQMGGNLWAPNPTTTVWGTSTRLEEV